MDRILVATDFSARSDRALRRATLIARRIRARLTLVHVVDGDRAERLISADCLAATALLAETVQTLRDTDGITSDYLVKVDDVYSGILAAAEQAGAELIVLGPHRSRLRNVFVGTTVERVVRRSPLPLLVAVQMPSAAYSRTLLALDLDEASRTAGRAALAMGIFEDTDVVLMHAFDTPAEGMMRRSMEDPRAIEAYVRDAHGMAAEKFRSLVSEIGLPPSAYRVAAIHGSPARTILESATAEGAQLVVLGTNQRNGFERLLIGSVTEDVIREAHRDILIVPVDGALG